MSVLDIAILLFLFFGLWQGFKNGLLRSLVSLFGWLFALLLATYFAKALAPLLSNFIHTPILALVIAFLGVALIILVLLQLILWGMSGILKGLHLSIVDKLAGAGFAVIKNLIIVLLLLSLIVPFIQSRELWQRSALAQALIPFAPFAKTLSKRLANEVSTTAQSSIHRLDNIDSHDDHAQAQ